MARKPNESELQLQGFLVSKAENYTALSLRPQGDYSAISTAPINICTVSNSGREYHFGGISEGFYDKMVSIYDWRDRDSKNID